MKRFLRQRRCIPKPRVAALAAHPGLPSRTRSKPQRGFTNPRCPRTKHLSKTNTAMDVRRLCNPVGVIALDCLARPRVRGVAANPGLWNLTPLAYVPCAARYASIATTSPCAIECAIAWNRMASTDWSRPHETVFTPTALHSIAQGRRASGAPWVTMSRAIQTPTGFYKSALPADQTFIQHQYGHERRAIV